MTKIKAHDLSLKQIQYLKLLGMSRSELDSFLYSFYEENPVVEISGEGDGEFDPVSFFSWLNEGKKSPVERSKDDEKPCRINPKSRVSDEKQNLYSFLESQFDFSLGSFDISLLNLIISSLDYRGYLISSDENIASRGYDISLVREAVSYIQSLEPAGIGARSLEECLSLQLARLKKDDDLHLKLVRYCLSDLAKGHFQKAARSLSSDEKKVRSAYEDIKKLNPIPASGFGREAPFSYMMPDVVIKNDASQLSAACNRGLEGRLYINGSYLENEPKDEETEKYIKEKTSQALWILKTVNSRRETIERIVSAIAARQKDFFLNGGELRPMKLKDVADALDIHESTVSRAVNKKYLECSAGIFPIKYFFTGNVSQGRLSNCLSSSELMKKIETIIKNEDKKKPLSDSAISALLQKEGILTARRTIAKYRGLLGIPTAGIRKAYK